MLREVMRYLDASFCAEVALLIFLGVFVAVLIRTIFTNKTMTQRQAIIPLSDGSRKERR